MAQTTDKRARRGDDERGKPERPISTYLVTNFVMPWFIFLYFVLNRTKVYGRNRVPRDRNTLLLCNHQSMIDSFLVGACAFYPWHFTRPHLIPWNAAAEENFFKNPFLAWLFRSLKCIPIRPGRRDVKAIYRLMAALRHGAMLLFPEGTRTRDGSVGKGRAGAGLLILGTQPSVTPVTIRGANDVLPVGRRVPRFGQRVQIYFGKPMDLSEFYDAERTKETSQEVVDRVMDRVRRQMRILERLERRERGSTGG